MGKIYKKITFLAATAFLCGGLSCFAQTAQTDGTAVGTDAAATEYAIDETTLAIGGEGAAVQNQRQSPFSTIFLLIRMILVLAIIIAGIYFVVWLLKRSTQVQNDSNPFMRVVCTVTLSPGKTVSIVTLLEHAYILGVTDGSVNLIGEVDDKELVSAMNVYADKNENTPRPKNFNDILSIFLAGGTRSKNQNIFSTSANKFESIFKNQRSRLHDDK